MSLRWGYLGTGYVTDPKGEGSRVGIRTDAETSGLGAWGGGVSAQAALQLCPARRPRAEGPGPAPRPASRDSLAFPSLLHCRLCTDHLGKTQQSDPNFRKTSLGTQLASAVAHAGWAGTISDSGGVILSQAGLLGGRGHPETSTEMDCEGSSPFCSPVIRTHQTRLVCTALLPRAAGCRLASWNPNYDNSEKDQKGFKAIGSSGPEGGERRGAARGTGRKVPWAPGSSQAGDPEK